MFDKAPATVWNLRPDSLALLLSLANVGAGSRALVLDNCQVRLGTIDQASALPCASRYFVQCVSQRLAPTDAPTCGLL
jgi:tRNA (adenine-N(1)-)-methyltransferase non-catalytic subunit